MKLSYAIYKFSFAKCRLINSVLVHGVSGS